MPTVVVCDDDSVLRQAISGLCEEAGLRVVAETDRGSDALELVRRFVVDVLVLDLALPDGSGEHILEAIAGDEPRPVVVVFTAYAPNPTHLLRLGAHDVIEKPDLGRLASVLERLAATAGAGTADAGGGDRRRTGREAVPLLSLWQSPSGISSAQDLAHALEQTVEGDTLLVIGVHGLDRVELEAGPVLALDCRLQAGRLLRAIVRVQDTLHEAPEVDGFVAVLRGGDGRAAQVVWKRLVNAVEASGGPGRLTGASATVLDLGAGDALRRAVAAVQAADSTVTELIDA
jgi:CheY-like chemotaxis protein